MNRDLTDSELSKGFYYVILSSAITINILVLVFSSLGLVSTVSPLLFVAFSLEILYCIITYLKEKDNQVRKNTAAPYMICYLFALFLAGLISCCKLAIGLASNIRINSYFYAGIAMSILVLIGLQLFTQDIYCALLLVFTTCAFIVNMISLNTSSHYIRTSDTSKNNSSSAHNTSYM